MKQLLNINVSNSVRSIRAIRVQINGILWSNFWTLMFQTLSVPFDSRAAKFCGIRWGNRRFCHKCLIKLAQVSRFFKIFVIKLSIKDSYVSNYIYFCTANQVPHIVGDAVWKLQIIRYIPVHEAFLSHDNAAFFICLCRWGGLFFCALASGFPFQQLLIF